jgi:uncharacterized protein
MKRRHFLYSLLGVSLTGTAVATVGALAADTHDLEVTRLPVRIGLRQPLRTVVLSDIHFDPVYDERYVERVVEIVNGLEPDLLVYMGDFITNDLSRIGDLSVLLSKTRSRLGAFACAGNHELLTNVVHVAEVLDARAGIRMLRNESVPLPGEDAVYLTGLDSYTAGNPQPGILERTPAASRHIVLVHEPDSFLSLTDPRVRLQISAHTHGGQICLPFVGPLVLPNMGHHFPAGLYASGNRRLYVNRGVGTIHVNLRIDCRPEITVLELT